MFIAPDGKRQTARLFSFLMQGERLAFACAGAQAKIFSDSKIRRFFANQARHEHFHAQVLKAGIGILMPKGVDKPMVSAAMNHYGRLLAEAFARNDPMETLLGMQVVLEGLGDVTLQRLDAGFPARGGGFRRVRKIILGQEDAHHGFGVRQLERYVHERGEVPEHLLNRTQDFLQLSGEMLMEVSPLFEYFNEDPEDYILDLKKKLPDWLTGHPA